jgi:formylglycine-generating enzyme required for sulfatase activity
MIDNIPRNAQYFTENLSGVPLDMIFIKGDTFTMGSPDSELDSSNNESPQHLVTIPDFYMGKYAVTQAQWRAIMGKNFSNFPGDNRPVEQVSWYETIDFCEKLSYLTGKKYRLPSEAEWEYACRAGTRTPFHFGETITPNLVNYYGVYPRKSQHQSPKGTTEVGSFPPNAFGLYDMHGNVSEWCQDIYHDNYHGAPTDGTSWGKNQEIDENTRVVMRGGSWDNLGSHCRSASRFSSFPGFLYYLIGFRLALSCTQ